MTKSPKQLTHDVMVYTDGSALGNPGPGGWGAVLLMDGIKHQMSGSLQDTTNNRAELQAVIESLSFIASPCNVTLFTDSAYVVKANQEWIDGWVERDWRTAANKPVKNKDLWIQLLDAARPHNVEYVWVKGHAGNVHNEQCDRMARRAAAKALRHQTYLDEVNDGQ